MIYVDIDGVLVDFIGTARKFGIELEINKFGRWKWWTAESSDGIDPEQFYSIAELQPWAEKLLEAVNETSLLATRDYAQIKCRFLNAETNRAYDYDYDCREAPDKSVHCLHPIDLLIDDNAAECERWRAKGGIAWHFNLAAKDPFGEFIKWWNLAKKEAANDG